MEKLCHNFCIFAEVKLFQIIAIIFCLGIFLIPKDNFYAQHLQEKCCTDSGTDCCKSRHSEHSKDKQKKEQKSSSCNDTNCCSTCVLCYSFIETPFSRSLQLEISYYKARKNLHDQYTDPHLSDRLKEIWQPPKLG
ncbi:hypothetical protein MKJ01_02330 [Chryseobacterium sp. SSA4.19]|uniref:hypothetical protein n=1 Tax=Chryseobacterium sp. SSA4.19 TaxID=2919915 RepID=UPI001F4F6F9D|nr:hypothetical protein [Chryseobacterium sp. SSA4.19]MCJ8152597.1 hypothetical protein [Chryseobacterium sp. SSA4.19]